MDIDDFDEFDDWESDEYTFEEQLERIDNDLSDEEILVFIDLVFDDPKMLSLSIMTRPGGRIVAPSRS